MQPIKSPSVQVASRRRPVAVWLVIAAVVGVLLVVVGIVAAVRSTTLPSSAAAGSAEDGLSTSEVLSVWDTALSATPRPLIIVGYGSNTQIGQWEPKNGGKQALLSRVVILAPDVAAANAGGPTHGVVMFGNSLTRAVTVLSAGDTARLLIADSGSPQACKGCTPVVLTHPLAITTKVETATGPATVPAWSFGVKGSAVRLVHASIDPADLLQTVHGLPYGLGNAETTVHVESDGRLTVRSTGSPSVATAGGCGADHRLEFVEGADVVVLRFVHLASTATETPEACPAYAVTQTETVAPPHPLGNRLLVLDRSGFVVPRV